MGAMSKIGLVCLIFLVTTLSVLAQSNQTNTTGNGTATRPSGSSSESLSQAGSGSLLGYATDSPFEFPELTGFELPIGNAKVTKGNHVEAGRIFDEGMSWLLEEGASLGISLKGDKYVLKIDKITTNKLTLSIEDVFERAIISRGKVSNFDLNSDNEYDLTIAFHKQYPPTGRFADISLFVSHETVQTEEVEVTEEPIEEETGEISFFILLLISLAIMAAIVGFCYAIIR